MAYAHSIIHRDVVCLGCGCLCDDLIVAVSAASIGGIDNACDLGRGWFEICSEETEQNIKLPPALVDGLPASVDEAITAAVALIRGSLSPFVVPNAISIEATSALVGLADRVGAVISPRSAGRGKHAAVERIGEISATLGEIRDRAELVVLWGVDLARDFPRFCERFLTEGVTNRTVVEINPEAAGSHSTEALSALRALLAGKQVDLERYEQLSKLPAQWVLDLAEHLKQARSGAFLYPNSLEATDPDAFFPLFQLVRDLNARGRFWALELGGGDNARGIASALTWTAGAPADIDFSQGYPRHLPGVVVDRTQRGESDLFIRVWGDRAEPGLEEGVVPMIAIGPEATRFTQTRVAIATRRMGYNDGGTVARTDGVLLPLTPLVPSDRPSLVEVVRSIVSRLDEETSG